MSQRVKAAQLLTVGVVKYFVYIFLLPLSKAAKPCSCSDAAESPKLSLFYISVLNQRHREVVQVDVWTYKVQDFRKQVHILSPVCGLDNGNTERSWFLLNNDKHIVSQVPADFSCFKPEQSCESPNRTM